MLFSQYRDYKSARGCSARNHVKTAGYAMQDFWHFCFSTQPHSLVELFFVCTKFVNPTCIAICYSPARSVQSVHLIQTFGSTLIGLRHKKITLRIESGLQEAFSRISQPIYSRFASGTTSRPEKRQDLCSNITSGKTIYEFPAFQYMQVPSKDRR